MMRVLHAEDDPQVADMVRLYFTRLGTSCLLEHVPDGRTCLCAMAKGTYDVLLLDLTMPEVDGLQVLGELAARRDPTPVVMVSAQGQHDLAVRALRAGAVDCIDKNSSEFRRIPEIAERVHARHRQRVRLPAPDLIRRHRVRFIDPDALERDRVARLFAASAPRIELLLSTSTDTLSTTEPPDAVILGPSLPASSMLETLHRLRAEHPELPVIVISAPDRAEVTIAAFKLGAHDYLLTGPAMPGELVFSLQDALKRADTERANARLTQELASLNRTLATQVADRTRELEREVAVRRAAEECAEEHAARLQALSNRLIRVQEEERGALARELHDQIGQLLTGLRFQLEAAREAASSPPLAEALATTGELLRTVRELTLQLRPRVLDDLGLGPALQWQARLFYGQTGIAVELDLALPPARLAAEIETSAFRLVQEALTNVARHSGAKTALVTATADDRILHVEVSDRGCGFNLAAAQERRDSLGLAGLAERVRLAGGQFEIVSHPGRGTRLHAEFPLLHLSARP